MEWKGSTTMKIKAAMALALVLLMVLGINLMYKSHFSELKQFYTSVYEDRLLAEHYLFQLSTLLQDKTQLLDESRELNSNDYHNLNVAIEEVLQKYELTKLTNTEARYFSSLKEHLKTLESLEINTVYANEPELVFVNGSIDEILIKIGLEMKTLADIQIIEAQSLIQDSNDIVASSNLTSRLQIGLIIFVGVILQVMIFSYQPSRAKFSGYKT